MLGGSDKASGHALYTHDVVLPGMLHAKVLRSPHPHARIVRIDASAAARMPGVHAIVTAADTPKRKYVHLGGPASDRYPLAIDRVRFMGEEVAAVAADDGRLAEEALRRIRVEYQVLPAVFDPDRAMAHGAPLIHEEHIGERVASQNLRNVASHQRSVFGDAARGLAEADVVAEDVFFFASQTHCFMETNACVAHWDGKRLTIWTSTQAPYFIQKELCEVLALPLEKVHIMEVAVGGGFGGKSKICEHEAVCALLAMKSGRPVKLVLTRDEDFRASKTRHPARITIRQGARQDGTLTARDMTMVMENGAYNATGPSIMGFGGMCASSLYRLDHFAFDGRLVYTNRQPGGQFRGYGNPQVTFAIESQMDILAERLGMDPLDFRLRNANQSGDTTPCGWKITTCGFTDCLERVAKAIGWREKRRNPRPDHGVGLASYIHCSGTYVYTDGDYSNVGVEIDESGKVLVRTGSADAGTWQNTTLAQIAAEAIGVRLEDCRVKSMDTDETPVDLGSWASRICFIAGNAARIAGGQIRQELLGRAAARLEAARDDLDIRDGTAFVKGSPHRGLAVAELAREMGGLKRTVRYETPTELLNRETGAGNISAAYTFGAQAVEVHVDRETGDIRLVDFACSNDVGQAINPLAVEGQIEGGAVQGIGAALTEELVHYQGQLVNPSFLDYGIPRAPDLPTIRTDLVETNDREGPFGAKGVGEPGLVPTAPAIANAIYHAVGVRVFSLPLTRAKILDGLRRSAGQPRRGVPVLSRPNHWWVAGMRALYPSVVMPILKAYGTRLAGDVSRTLRFETSRAETLPEAVRLLGEHRGRAKVLAGGTDLLAGIEQGIYRPDRVVDVSEIPELRRAEVVADEIVLGAGVPLADLEGLEPLRWEFPALLECVRQIATPQIRNMATVGGNLCQEKRCWFFRNDFVCYKRGGWSCPCYAILGDNRAHAIVGAHRCQAVCHSDLATVVASLGATVDVFGPGGLRSIAFERFYRGPGEPDLRPGEIVTAVRFRRGGRGTVAAYEKIRTRESDFATVSGALQVRVDDAGRCREARIALGGIGYKPWRVPEAEAVLVGASVSPTQADRIAEILLRDQLPLRDNGYKVDLCHAVVRRLLARAATVR